ncbi:AlpA family phage regulatory protein [Klebsiella quasipneumoniae]
MTSSYLGMQSVGWLESELDEWLLKRHLASSTTIAEQP